MKLTIEEFKQPFHLFIGRTHILPDSPLFAIKFPSGYFRYSYTERELAELAMSNFLNSYNEETPIGLYCVNSTEETDIVTHDTFNED